MKIQKRSNNLLIILAIISIFLTIQLFGFQNQTYVSYVLVGMLGVIMVMAIFLKPSLGANILIVATFTNVSRHLMDHGYPTIIKPLVVLVAASVLARYFFAKRNAESGISKTRTTEMFLLLYFAVMAFSYLVAADKNRAYEAIFDMGKDVLIIYCILFTIRKPSSWKQSVWTVILVTAALSMLGVYQVVTGNYGSAFFGFASVFSGVSGNSTAMRLGGPINAPNLWGQVVVAVIPLVVYRIIQESRILVKFSAILILGVLLIELLNTYSRGAYIALAIIFLMLLFEVRINILVKITSIGFAIAFLLMLPQSYLDRIQSLLLLSPTNEYGIYQDSSIRGRSSEMLAGFSMFTSHPLLGVGVGNYRNNYQEYAQAIGIEVRAEERDTHSLYVEVLAETGALGMFAFLGIVFSLLSSLNRTRKLIQESPVYQTWLPWLNAIQLSLLGYLLTSFFLHGAYIRYFWILVALAMSSVHVLNNVISSLKRSTSSETSI